MAETVLLTDLDNTLYNWVDYYAPSFRAMVYVLARELKVKEERLLEEFREVYGRHRSLEYAFSVQELKVCEKLPVDEVERIVRLAKGAFSRVREKNLMLYDGVLDTLRWAVKSGVIVIGVTNAPVENAKGRIKQLGIDRILSGLAALDSPDVPDDGLELTRRIAEKEKAGYYLTELPEWKIFRLKEAELKPNSSGYKRIVEELGLHGGKVYVIGDSIGKDLAPAKSLGYTTILARYGQLFAKRNLDTLLRITHWSGERIELTYDAKDLEPDFTIDSFEDLRSIMDPPQLSLFAG